MDAIDSVNTVIELCNCLKLDDDNEGGLTPMAVYGYHWVTILMRGAFTYVSDRLIMLNRQQQATHRAISAYLLALLTALPSLDDVNCERFLDSAASQMSIAQIELDQFIHEKARL